MQAKIKAGVAKKDITDRSAGLVNDPLYVKALVLDNGLIKMVMASHLNGAIPSISNCDTNRVSLAVQRDDLVFCDNFYRDH